MKATIKLYNCNADVFENGLLQCGICWDGCQWDNEQEWDEWADDVLSNIKDADNYDDIKMSLHIHTQHRIKD